MNELQSKLMRCFAAVFPGVSHQKIVTSGLDALEGWDSVTAASLISTIEEEFETELDLDSLGDHPSFHSIQAYLNKQFDT